MFLDSGDNEQYLIEHFLSPTNYMCGSQHRLVNHLYVGPDNGVGTC